VDPVYLERSYYLAPQDASERAYHVLLAASLNAIGTAWLGLTARALPGRAITAYWTLMYLLIAVLFTFVIRPGGPALPSSASGHGPGW
jgi:hypothetical protein